MSVFKPIARLYKQLNPATLSGAIDIVIVKQPDGSFACSPFHVRFGKFQVPYASISTPEVEIMINGEICDSLTMVVGDNGEALFYTEEIIEKSPELAKLEEKLGTLDPIPNELTSDEDEEYEENEDELDEYDVEFDEDEGEYIYQDGGFTLIQPLTVNAADPSDTTNNAVDQKTDVKPKNSADIALNRRKRRRKRKSLNLHLPEHSRTSASKADDSSSLANKQHHHPLSSPQFDLELSRPSIRHQITEQESSSVPPSSQLSIDTISSISNRTSFTPVVTTQASKLDTVAALTIATTSSYTVNDKQANGVSTVVSDHHGADDSESFHTAPKQLNCVTKVMSSCDLQSTEPLLRNSCSIPHSDVSNKLNNIPYENEIEVGSIPPDDNPDDKTKRLELLKRPESPKSDSEIGTSTNNVVENVSWLWGEHLEPYQPENPPSPQSAANRVGLITEEKAAHGQRFRSLSPAVPNRNKTEATEVNSNPKNQGGIYLENLASVDQTTKRLYLCSTKSSTSFASPKDSEIKDPLLRSSSSRSLCDKNSPDKLCNQISENEVGRLSMPSSPRCGHLISELSTGAMNAANCDSFGLVDTDLIKSRPYMETEEVSTQTHIGSDGEVLHCNLEMSLCGGLKGSDSVISQDSFDKYLITYDDFQTDPFGVLSNPNLVVKMNGCYFKWQVAAPLIISHIVFQRALDDPAKSKLMKDYMAPSASASKSGWSWWRSSRNVPSTNETSRKNNLDQSVSISVNSSEMSNSLITVVPTATSVVSSITETTAITTTTTTIYAKDQESATKSSDGSTILKVLGSNQKKIKMSNRLTSSQIAALNLHEGSNDISFRITSQFMGSTTLQANIFVFDYREKIVISDVDGTVTRSDVMGQILPQIGVTDWSQENIVNLYQKIAAHGYKFIYLSARAISMASMTKTYLRKVCQNKQLLPDGPLLLSPASLASAFHQEVILKKPEEFKIRCLTDIKSLFPFNETDNPFYAGFGNKSSDSVSYSSVAIPASRIFIINHKGDVKVEHASSLQTSYFDLCGKVDYIFPPLNSGVKLEHHNYTSFHYWRNDPVDHSNQLTLSLEASYDDATTVSASAVSSLNVNAHSSSASLKNYSKK